jgi:hypothetical protein
LQIGIGNDIAGLVIERAEIVAAYILLFRQTQVVVGIGRGVAQGVDLAGQIAVGIS